MYLVADKKLLGTSGTSASRMMAALGHICRISWASERVVPAPQLPEAGGNGPFLPVGCSVHSSNVWVWGVVDGWVGEQCWNGVFGMYVHHK